MADKPSASILWALIPGGSLLLGGILVGMKGGSDFPFALGMGLAGGLPGAIIGYAAGLFFNHFKR